jgi:hypothetical protein
MSKVHINFEALRSALSALDVPTGEARRLYWVLEGLIGAARTSSGDFEIFLLGKPLESRSVVVRRCLQYDVWRPTTGGSSFDATRVALPPDPHFAAMAALIATEMVRAGLGTGVALQDVFIEVEPIIELAIQRASLTDEALLGLLSELLVLRTILRASERSSADKAVLVDTWRGWQRGRDFVMGRNVVEVKATRSLNSRHAFSGLHQLEEQLLPDGESEVLYLLSIGLQEVSDGGTSLPNLVDELLMDLGGRVDCEKDQNTLQAQLLSHIASYGASGSGYRHLSMREWPQYRAQFALSFSPRFYRIADSAMRLLPRATVEETFLHPESLMFEASFPSQVSAFNPSANWQVQLAEMADLLL